MLSLLKVPAESSRGALSHRGFGLSASAPRLHLRRLPSRLTSRSSRRRFVASLKLPGMRAILAPIRRVRRGLTPALGGKEHSAVSCSFRSALRLRLACSSDNSPARCLFGCCAKRAHMSHALRLPASEATVFICKFSASDPRLRTPPAGGLRGALNCPGFGFRSARPQFSVAGFRPA